jgi:hypothetical protein
MPQLAEDICDLMNMAFDRGAESTLERGDHEEPYEGGRMNVPLSNDLESIVGKRIGGEPANEAEHFYECAACGQAVDKRQLGDVFHHEEPGHKPLVRQ